MEIRVSARQTEIAQKDRDLIVEKITRLGERFLSMDFAEVHFFQEQNPRISDNETCEVTMQGHGHHVRCKASGPDHLTAADRTVDKLENKLHRLKSKVSDHRGRGTKGRAQLRREATTELPVALLDEIAGNGEVDEFEINIVKTKRVEKLTLSPQDAAQRMDLVDHDFYFFTNAETGRGAVVYRRDDGDVGLIDEGV